MRMTDSTTSPRIKPWHPRVSSTRILTDSVPTGKEQLAEHQAEARSPVLRRPAQRTPGRTLVEDTVGWTRGQRRVLAGAQWVDRHGALQQPEDERLLLHRDGQVVPARHAGLRPVVHPRKPGLFGDGPDRLGQGARPGRG